MINETKEQYIGDGVYATWDGYHVVLDMRGQRDSGEPLIAIVLEPEVFDALIKFRQRMTGGGQ
jgi:hypothetical protein